MAADRGRLREACDLAHTGSGPIGYKLSRGEAFFRSVFVTATMPTSTPVASTRGEGVSYRVFGTGTLPTSISVASPRGEGSLMTGLRHVHHAHKYLRGILAWRRGLLDGLRHGDLAHRCLRGIPAWRRRLLTALRHVHHAHKYLRGILAWRRRTSDRSSARRSCLQAPQSHHGVPKRFQSGKKQ